MFIKDYDVNAWTVPSSNPKNVGFFLSGKSICSWFDVLSDRFFMVDPLSYLSFQPVIHDWCNKVHGMCCLVRDGAYKRTFAANWKEQPMLWQQVSSLII